MNLLIGTSGYSYSDWVGPVYPPGTPAKDYLSVYQRLFSFTELNFSYYKQPDPRTLDRMVNSTDDNFTFAIKAHKSITHEISDSFNDDVTLFKNGIRPLIETSKLAAILIQFPYSFHYTPQSRKHVLSVCEAFAGLPAAVEFRSSEWQKDSVYKGLEDNKIAFVNVDVPALAGLPGPTNIVTSDFAYIRFHGRNEKQWWKGDNASRYDYLYSEEELAGWVDRIKKMAKQSGKVIIAFNNHWKGQAVTNAKRIREIIEEGEGD